MAEETKKAFLDLILDALRAVLEDSGPAALLLVAAIIIMTAGFVCFFLLHERLWKARMADKDAEIKRLVEERNRYQAMFVKRISSE